MPSKRPRKRTPSPKGETGSRAKKPASSRKAGASKAPETAGSARSRRAGAAKSAKAPNTPRPVGPRRAALLARAAAAGIAGRHRMTIPQLQAALARLAEPPSISSPPVAPDLRPLVVGSPPPVAGLPWQYGVTELVAMPVDPLLVYVYWELTPEAVARARADLGALWEGSQQVLRAYEVGNTLGGQNNGDTVVARARHHFDSDVGGDVGSYYVHLWSPEQTLVFELGWRSRGGRFVAAVRSNLVRTPRNAPCGGEERWMTVRNGRIVTTP
ncbi:MAG TPA: DUF4912 domain-containing protein, partial [Nitrospiria bacterium]|nr:DUF4912 domain-containing protein [Nitrospiria bacterium]